MAEIGPKRHRVTVERRSAATNDFGQDTDAWAAQGTYWARLKTLSGRELATAQQVRPEMTVRVEMRAGIDVTPEDRLTHGGRVFNILSVSDPDERGRDLVVDCAEWKGAVNP